MNGVRVQNIHPQYPKKVLIQYFSDLCGPGNIVNIYYPLLNNTAVVIFKDFSVTSKVLTSKHDKLTVLPLPNQVFNKQRIWLEKDLSSLLRDHDQYQEDLKNNGHVDITYEKSTQQITITGQFYQIEWAWRYLSDLQDRQQMIPDILGSASNFSNGDVLPNGDVDYMSMQETHNTDPISHTSPSFQNDQRLQNRDVVSLAIEGVSSGRRLPSPSLLAMASHGSRPRSPAHQTGAAASDVTSLNIEGLADDRMGSPSGTVSGRHSRASPAHQDRASPDQSGARPRTFPMKAMPSDNDPRTYLGESEQREHLKTLVSHASRQVFPEDAISAFSSLPVRNSGTGRSSTEGDDTRPQSTNPNSRGLPQQTVASSRDQDRAEVAHRASRQHHSMGYPLRGSQYDDSYGAVGGPMSLREDMQEDGGRQSFYDEDQQEDPSHDDMEPAGAYGGRGQRAFSSLPYYSSASLKLPTNNKLALLNRSVVELSRKHFDVGPRLKLKIYVDDITKTRTQAVVNAANWELKNIGGVAGALAKAAGPEMEKECQRIYMECGALRTAQVVKTKAYGKLNHLRYVLHTVGPIYNQSDPDKCVFELAQTFLNCVLFAEKLNLNSFTFPFISAGIFGMPVEHCVTALLTALKKYSHERFSKLTTLEEVHIINNDIDFVCNAILAAEISMKKESTETCLKRMEEGVKLYGRYIYPFCDQKAPPAAKASSSDERHATWDSSGSRDAGAVTDEGRGRHRSRDQVTAEPAATRNSSSSRGRSQSYDRNKTVAADGSDARSSSNAKVRDSSPMPKPRSRSNSTSSANRGSSGATKAAGSSTSTNSTTPRSQPVIKQSIVPPATGSKKRAMGLAKSVGIGRSSDHSGNDTDASSAAASETEDPDKTCPICLEDLKQPKKLACGHQFCTDCADKAMAVNPRCPKCQRLFGIPFGTQPSNGTMFHSVDYRTNLSGYPGCGTITITYDFPPGRQEACHPNPGRYYDGTHRVAYLPGNQEGREVLKMLQRAFHHRLVFTIGDSVTTGAKGVITWNDIHHKTSTYGGPSQFGYPDPDYLYRVKEELASKGITHP
ncbi:uncharacterized protein LOC143293742 isoform X2 [Babylonia areolata]